MSSQSLGRCVRLLAYVAILGCSADRASAEVLFSDNFNTNTSGAWTVNAAPAANAGNQQATFAFDYSTMGIPAAPGSSDTLGLQLKANIPGSAAAPVTSRPPGALSGLSVSPTGESFGTNYQVSFYAWANYFGSPNAAGLGDNVLSQGGTNNVLFAVGTSGAVPVVVGSTAALASAPMNGVAFVATNDGGLTDDYRVFAANNVAAAANSGVYAAGTAANSRGNENTFYTERFPSVQAPPEQAAIATAEYDDGAFNTQNGNTPIGSFGFAWHKVVITKNNGTITWEINDDLFATVDASALALGGENLALGVSDVNTTTARHPSLLFGLFDNLVVTDIPAAGLAGDFNGDDVVNGNDFTLWQRGGSPAPYSAGDLATWKAHFGEVAPGVAVAAAVPEPAAVGLAGLAVLTLGVSSRRRGGA